MTLKIKKEKFMRFAPNSYICTLKSRNVYGKEGFCEWLL